MDCGYDIYVEASCGILACLNDGFFCELLDRVVYCWKAWVVEYISVLPTRAKVEVVME